MKAYRLIILREHPVWKEAAARWFHARWGIPLEAYRESIEASLAEGVAVPSWYLCLDGQRIVGGMGVIENDFHNRKDLTPNVCAVYTEEDCRGQGIAGELLGFVCRDMRAHGLETLYLVTDLTGFYERYGWAYLCMVQGDGEEKPSRMYMCRLTETPEAPGDAERGTRFAR